MTLFTVYRRNPGVWIQRASQRNCFARVIVVLSSFLQFPLIGRG